MTGPPALVATSPWVIERSGKRLMSVPCGLSRRSKVSATASPSMRAWRVSRRAPWPGSGAVIAPVHLLLDEAPIVGPGAHEDGRGLPRGGDAPELGELIEKRSGDGGQRGLLLGAGSRLGPERQDGGEPGRHEKKGDDGRAAHVSIVPQPTGISRASACLAQRRAVSAMPATTRSVERRSSGARPSRPMAAATSTPQIGVVRATVA